VSSFTEIPPLSTEKLCHAKQVLMYR